MEQLFKEAASEFKRVDHLFYVSLKYTRTGDVLISIVNRLIACLDKCIEILYKKKGIEDLPDAPIPRVNKIREEYLDDKKILKILDLYILLRKVGRSEKSTTGEFRRTLRTEVTLPDGELLVLDIYTMLEYYKIVDDFMDNLKDFIYPEEDY